MKAPAAMIRPGGVYGQGFQVIAHKINKTSALYADGLRLQLMFWNPVRAALDEAGIVCNTQLAEQ